MKTKRIVRWAIVLFLLAALPLVTAVKARNEEPVRQPAARPDSCAPLPVPGEPNTPDALPPPNRQEGETNDTRGDANRMSVGDVMWGRVWLYELCAGEDVDFFKFNLPADATVLIDLDYYRTRDDDNMFTQVCLLDAAGNSLVCDDDRDASDLLLYYALGHGDYFIKINALDGLLREYIVTLSRPLLVSAAAGGMATGGSVDGIQFFSDDILAWSDLYGTQETWDMLLDASQVGIARSVVNIASNSGDNLLLTLAANQTLPGVGTVGPYDIFVFDPTQLGSSPAGAFRWGLPGGEHGLTTTGEKVDAIDGWVNGYDSCYGFPVSTSGIANVPSWNSHIVKQDNDDIFCKVYNGNWEPWRYFFDVKGKNNAPPWWERQAVRVQGLPAENVVGAAYNDVTDVMYLTVQGAGNIQGHLVTQKDIFAINYPGYTWGGIVWHGPDHGWNYNIDAIELNSW